MGWVEQKLSSLCDMFTDGDWVESKDQSAEGIRLIQTGNIGEGVFKNRRNKSRFISNDTFKRLKCTEIIESDCLVSRLPDPVGRSCLIPYTGEKMITAVDCTIIRLNKIFLLPEFFIYFTQSYTYLTVVESLTTGATRKRISRKNLGEVRIPLPPIPEQQRIVAILDQAFADIEKARTNAKKNLMNARELFDSYLNQVFSQRGEHWVEQKLSLLCKIFDSRRKPITKKDRSPGIYPYYDATGILDYVDGYLFDEKLVLIGEDGAKWDAGDTSAFSIEGKTWVNNHAHVIQPIRDRILDKWLIYYLNGEDLSKFITGMTVPKLNQGKLKEIPIPLPPIPEQHRIVDSLDKLSGEVHQLEKRYQEKLESLDELKKSLLQKAFSGELTKTEGHTA